MKIALLFLAALFVSLPNGYAAPQGTCSADAPCNANVPAVPEPNGWKGPSKQIAPLFPHIRSDKWAVVTSINRPNDAIHKLASLPGWKLVVVGDTKTPADWTSHLKPEAKDNVVFLSVEDQKMLGFEVAQHIPYRNYGRKALGYLFAIQHGATTIFETDDDNLVETDDIPILPEVALLPVLSPHKAFTYPPNNYGVVNPYGHFGRPDVWPRGLPLNAISDKQGRHWGSVSAERKMLRVPIQQALADGDPDVDAIFRLTQAQTLDKIRFDRKAHPLALADNAYTPWNSQVTTWHYSAFWGLALPVTVTFRVLDIWRAYFALRLVKEMNGTVAFLPPCVTQDRNAHDYLKDFEEEADLYAKSHRLVSYLHSWTPTHGSKHFFDNVQQLANGFVEQQFWGSRDAQLVHAFLRDLLAVGYDPSKIMQAQV